MRKKLLASLLSLCMLAGMLPTTAFAASGGEDQASPTCICAETCTEEAVNTDCPVCSVESTGCSVGTAGSSTAVLEGETIEVPSEALIIVSGTYYGVSKDWFTKNNPEQATLSLAIKIPSDVTAIANDGFRDSWSSEKEDNGAVTTNDGIGGYSVVSLDFSEATSLTTINNQAAMYCSKLTGVLDLSATKVTTIGKSAFSGCTGLTGVVLPDTLTTLGAADGSSGSVFRGCSSLRFITTSDKYKAHEGDASFTDFSLPDGLTTIGKETFANAFADVDLTVVIPASVKTIGSEAFYPRSNTDGLSYLPVKVIIIEGTDVSGFHGRAFKFYDSGAPEDYRSSSRVVVLPDKNTYDAFMKKASGNIPDKEANTYALTLNYYDGETAEGTPYCTEEKLYKQSIRYTKQEDGLWSYDENYALPEVPGGAPQPGYQGSVWMMDGKELTVDSKVTTDTVTLKSGGGLTEPEVSFTVEHNPRQGKSWTEPVENGASITVDLAVDQSVDIVPVIEHPLAGKQEGDVFFWYRWQDSTGDRNDEGEDFTFGETINTLRIDALDEARPESKNQCYYIDIEGKTVSSSWGPDYDWDGDPVYTSSGQTYHIHINVVKVENLASVAAADYGYFIEHDPDYAMTSTYPTAEALIEQYLIAVFGEDTYIESDSYEEESLSLSWQLKPGAEYSSLPGAENTFVWTASQEEFEALGWTNTNNIPLTGELTLTNPESITITPANITIYSGGDGYSGIVDDDGADSQTTGFPEPGYYITLPHDLNDLLGGDEHAANLSGKLSLQFQNHDGTAANRTWELALYGTDENHSSDIEIGGEKRARYIYKILPAQVGEDEVPAHLEIIDADGNIVESDAFTPDPEHQHMDYTIRFCTEGLDLKDLTFQLVLTDETTGQETTYTRAAELGTGSLVVRGVTDSADAIREIASTPEEIKTTGKIAAVAPAGITYYVNGSNVEVADPSGVRMLADSLIGDEAAAQAMIDYIKSDSNDLDIPTTANTMIQPKYLDLVDSHNGNAYLTIKGGQKMTIYWPVPSDFDANTTAYIVHFAGLDRDYDNAAAALDPEQIELAAPVTVNGAQYFRFETGSFSPFVLVYEKTSSGGGGGGTTRYTIKAEAGEGGTISPSGSVLVTRGADKTFTIKPGTDYQIADVLVDGESVGAVSSYTFENVRASHTIRAVFEEADQILDPDETGVSDWLNTKDHTAYLNGYGTGAFGPTDNMTRAEAAQMFYNLLLNKHVTITVSFTDVPADAWYSTAVNTLASLGFLDGVGGGRFEPERAISRAEFTALAMRFADLEVSGKNIFSDVHSGDWFYDLVVGSIQYGWITGYADGTFRPNSTITRAEAATVTNRMLGRAADEDYVDRHTGDLRLFPDVPETYWAYYAIVEASNTHDYTMKNGVENWTGL